MSLSIPEDWVEDTDYLDIRRSIGNLTCPKHVVSSAWAREKGIAGIPVTSLHHAHFLYQGWNSYGLPREKKRTLLWPEPSPKWFSSVRSSPKFVIKPWTLMLQPQTMPFKLRLRKQKILQSRHPLNT